MVVYTFNIINRDGGLVYCKEFVRTQPVDLRLVSSFHVMHAMLATLSPVPSSSGIEQLVAEAFKLTCRQTATGVKFYIVTDRAHADVDAHSLLDRVYALYTDYVLKNPFYAVDQPIRCAKFDSAVAKLA